MDELGEGWLVAESEMRDGFEMIMEQERRIFHFGKVMIIFLPDHNAFSLFIYDFLKMIGNFGVNIFVFKHFDDKKQRFGAIVDIFVVFHLMSEDFNLMTFFILFLLEAVEFDSQLVE